MRPMGAIVGREVQERRGGGGVLTKMCFEDMFTPVFPLCFVCVLCLVFFLILPLRPKTKTTTTDPSYFLFFFLFSFSFSFPFYSLLFLSTHSTLSHLSFFPFPSLLFLLFFPFHLSSSSPFLLHTLHTLLFHHPLLSSIHFHNQIHVPLSLSLFSSLSP